MQVSTLRPGLLVSLKTSIVGNATYSRETLEADHLTEDGAKRARWETERVITDPVERELAIQVRTKCRILVCKPCSFSSFGLLCPEDSQDDLNEAIRQAQAIAAEFNSTAKLTRVSVYVIAGRIAADDLEAVKAINSEVRGLMDDMKIGIEKLDVKAVRDAANKAKSIGGRLMSPTAAERIKVAVEAARECAKQIVKAGEETSLAIDRSVIRKIAESRTAFLDLEDAVEVTAPVVTGRAVDLTPIEAAVAAAPKKGRAICKQNMEK